MHLCMCMLAAVHTWTNAHLHTGRSVALRGRSRPGDLTSSPPVWQVSLSQTQFRKCRYAGFAGLKVCTELPDSFFRMKDEAGAGWGLIQGDRVAFEPPSNPRKTSGKTARKPPGKAPFLGNFCQSQ